MGVIDGIMLGAVVGGIVRAMVGTSVGKAVGKLGNRLGMELGASVGGVTGTAEAGGADESIGGNVDVLLTDGERLTARDGSVLALAIVGSPTPVIIAGELVGRVLLLVVIMGTIEGERELLVSSTKRRNDVP